MYDSFSIIYTLGRYLCCFHTMAIVSDAAMNVETRILFLGVDLMFCIYTNDGLLGHMVELFLIYFKFHSVFLKDAAVDIPTNSI